MDSRDLEELRQLQFKTIMTDSLVTSLLTSHFKLLDDTSELPPELYKQSLLASIVAVDVEGDPSFLLSRDDVVGLVEKAWQRYLTNKGNNDEPEPASGECPNILSFEKARNGGPGRT